MTDDLLGSAARALRLYPGPSEELAADAVYADLFFPDREGPRGQPYVAINMVSTLDGKASVGGRASPIGSGTDRAIMRNLRCAADAVLVGAGTLRAEELNLGVPQDLAAKRRRDGRPEQPFGIVLAGSRDLPLHRKLFSSEGLTTNPNLGVLAGASTPHATLEHASSLGVRVLKSDIPGRLQPREILALLTGHLGINSLLLEGGPTVNASFLSAGAVDELFLTLSPKILATAGETSEPSIVAQFSNEAQTLGLNLTSVHCSPDESELYLRYSTGLR